jgi:hypothetical protein
MAYTDPCLGPTGVGVLDANGNLTQAARDAFTAQVILLLTSGNADGKGAKISSLLNIPFPPPSGVKLLDPDRLLTHPSNPLGDLFWFDPSPFAPLVFDTLRDPEGGYQKNIVTNLYQPIMKAMNLSGGAAVPPVLDYSGFLPPDIAVNVTIPKLPQILAALSLPDANAINLALKKLIDLDPPDAISFVANLPKALGAPPLPSLPTPPLPDFDFIVFPEVFLGLVQLPIKLLPSLISSFSPPDLLSPSPPDLFGLVLKAYFGPFLEILKQAGLLAILPKLLVATMIVIIQNSVCAMVPMVVSQIIGTGIVVKFLGQALGLA